MHKLKNKHTGEEIKTPYMAEVEEYLNIGDYEMSDKKYPYIGESISGNKYLVYSKSNGFKIDKGTFHSNLNADMFENITHEHLANTYGKCESQEHADFIYSLADSHGIEIYSNHHIFDNKSFFYFCDNELHLERGCFESFARDTSKKLINLPLPKKEKSMEETKPFYTKEMHGRGELPPVGSEVLFLSEVKGVVNVNNKDDAGFIILNVNGEYELVNYKDVTPIPTIEDELIEFVFQNSGIRRRDGGKESAKDVAKALLEKYNITPKDS